MDKNSHSVYGNKLIYNTFPQSIIKVNHEVLTDFIPKMALSVLFCSTRIHVFLTTVVPLTMREGGCPRQAFSVRLRYSAVWEPVLY